MNFLELSEAMRPDFATRERSPGIVEVQCPFCRQWRPGFAVAQLDSATDAALAAFDPDRAAAASVAGWACDGDLSRYRRAT